MNFLYDELLVFARLGLNLSQRDELILFGERHQQ